MNLILSQIRHDEKSATRKLSEKITENELEKQFYEKKEETIMTKILFLTLALTAVGLFIYYGLFYEVSIPGATYNQTYALLSILAAIIFGGLFFASRANRQTSKSGMLFD